MTIDNRTVFVVDDDEQARHSVCALVRSMDVNAESFGSAKEFLDFYTIGRPGCLVTDLRMFGMSGVELQEKMINDGISLPVIVITAYANTPLTVEVIKKGAVTLLEKPYQDDELWKAIRKALEDDAIGRQRFEQRRQIQDRIAKLSPKELDVMKRVVGGKANKVIAKELDISVRTVENRRRVVFAKMETESVAQLVQQVIQAESSKATSATA